MHTTAQAAEILGITSRRVRQMIVAGDMEATKAGRDFLIAGSQIEKAKARKQKPGPKPSKKGSSK